MELNNKARYTLLITYILSIILFFFVGYKLGHVKPSKLVYSNEINEIVDVLDENYYKEYDKDKFVKGYLKGGVSTLNDPYTYLRFEESNSKTNYVGFGIGVSEKPLGLKIGTVYKESPAYKVGIREGDYLIGVDDLKIGNDSIDAINTYLEEAKEEITMYLLRNYKEFSVKITKGEVICDPKVTYKLFGSIGYIKINDFDENASNLFNEALVKLESENITGLLIDVRNNPGGSAYEVSRILNNFLTGTDAFLYLDSKSKDTPTVYRANNAEKKSYDIKVLINENSASASEVFALAMNRVMGYDLVGTTTYGKGVFQQDFKLSSIENAYIHVTCGYWYGPKMANGERENIHGKGIDATVEVLADTYVPFPISDNTYSIDTANDDIKNIEIMLKTIGNEVRVDGYFDSNLETILQTKYSSTTLTKAVQQKIYDDYVEYINDYNNDIVLQAALDLLK